MTEKKVYFDTGSGLDKMVSPQQSTYPQGLGFRNKNEFLQWIDGAVVLDVGSGLGLLAKSVALEKSTAKVISLNPSLVYEETVQAAREATRSYLEINDPGLISVINEVHDKNAIASSWENIPLPDESVDRIVSHLAFPKYCKSLVEFRNALKEMNRVLKKGGEIRLHKPMVNLVIPEGAIASREDKYLYFKSFIEELGLKTAELPELDEEGNVSSPFICLSIKKS